MQAMPVRIFLVLFLLVLIYPPLLVAAPESRTALVIGNSTYSSGPLKNPVNDATDMATTLQKLGFTVILKKNANLETMEEAIEDFGNRLKRGGVGLFYYAGHGVQLNGVNYLIPVGAKINKETDVRFKAFDAGRVLAEMENANNGLNIVLLDACRDNPFGKSFRSASRGLAIVSSAPAGTFISYSTGPGQVARDGEGRNSPYTAALLKYMIEAGQPVEQVFKRVRQTLAAQSGGKQIPWELSSLQGNFFFAPGSERPTVEPFPTDMRPQKPEPARDHAVDELDAAMAKIQRQKEEKAAQKVEREEKFKGLLADVKKYRFIVKENIDEEIKAAAWKGLIKKYSVWSGGVETGQADRIVLQAMADDLDGDFKTIARKEGFKLYIANGDGTVTDILTGLMWAAKDNGSDVNWSQAQHYCFTYNVGGHRNWRMPKEHELAELIDGDKQYKSACGANVNLTETIRLSCTNVWADEWHDSYAANIHFDGGVRYLHSRSNNVGYRALPVRSVK